MICTTEEEARHKRGKKCQTCGLMANSNAVTVRGVRTSWGVGTVKLTMSSTCFGVNSVTSRTHAKIDTPRHLRVNSHPDPWKVQENTRFPQLDLQVLSLYVVSRLMELILMIVTLCTLLKMCPILRIYYLEKM